MSNKGLTRLLDISPGTLHFNSFCTNGISHKVWYGEGHMLQFEPVHEISNNVAFWHVYTGASLCSLLWSLESPNGVQSVALQS